MVYIQSLEDTAARKLDVKHTILIWISPRPAIFGIEPQMDYLYDP